MLRRISTDLIKPGLQLPGALRDETGRVLIPAGVELTEPRIQQLGKRLLTGLYVAEDWPEDQAEGSSPTAPAAPRAPEAAAPATRTAAGPVDVVESPPAVGENQISVDLLYVNMCLSRDLYGDDGLLLLAAGTRITPRFLALLQARKIRSVHLEPPSRSAARDADPRFAAIDRQLEQELRVQPARLRSRTRVQRPRLPLQDLYAEAREALQRHSEVSNLLADVCSVQRGVGTGGQQAIEGAVSDFVNMLTLDCDLLLTVVSMQRTFGEYLFDHSVNVAMLSMTIGDQVGLPREHLLELGLGALFLDVGMLKVSESIRFAERQLTPAERAEVNRHPVYTLDYLEQKTQFSPAVRFIGYQAHERSDGTGYPRGRKTIGIHPMARIVAIADIYSAMTRARPYRPPLAPHDAIKELLFEGQANLLERPLIRALLDRISVFPVGSLVELSSGARALVSRATPGCHTRPVVTLLDARGEPAGESIDLARTTDVQVVRALKTSEQPQPSA